MRKSRAQRLLAISTRGLRGHRNDSHQHAHQAVLKHTGPDDLHKLSVSISVNLTRQAFLH